MDLPIEQENEDDLGRTEQVSAKFNLHQLHLNSSLAADIPTFSAILSHSVMPLELMQKRKDEISFIMYRPCAHFKQRIITCFTVYNTKRLLTKNMQNQMFNELICLSWDVQEKSLVFLLNQTQMIKIEMSSLHVELKDQAQSWDSAYLQQKYENLYA